MSNWKVLVIDDEIKAGVAPREEQYAKLNEQTYDSRGFQLEFAQNPDHARNLLQKQRNQYDIVLLDVILTQNGWDDKPNGILFKELFKLASSRFLVALVSHYWDMTSIELVRNFLHENEDIDQPLFFTFKDFESGGLAAIAVQIITFIRRKNSLYRLELASQSKFNILHLSDLHFGSTNEAKTIAGEPRIDYLCDKIMSEWPQGPHIVAVTGDIGNTGHPDDYKRAFDWFQRFTNQLKISLPSPRLLLVPGNHDVSIPLAGAQHIYLDDKNTSDKTAIKKLRFKAGRKAKIKISENPLNSYVSQPFSEFADKVSSTTGSWCRAPIGCWTEFGFAEYGVVFSGFNTSKKIGNNSWPLREIDDEDINQVINIFKENGISADSGILHISLSHHSLVNYQGVSQEVPSNDIFAHNFLSQAFAPKLFLHGHQHRRWDALPDGMKYMVIAAPSPNRVSQGPESPRGVNMISLERDGSCIKKITAQSLVYLEKGWSFIKLPNEYELCLKSGG